jgi:aspartyl-tRNA(Asn)/glutamyl-tRNA(Gln) amidotransferase subunit A
MGSSLDVIGPLTNSVTDAKILFDVIKGRDSLDMTSHDGGGERKENVKRIGVPREFFNLGLDVDVSALFDTTLTRLTDAGYEVVDITLPSLSLALPTYYVLMPAEASSNLARYDGVKYGLHKEGNTLLEDYLRSRGQGFGPEVRRRILLGTYVLSAGYYDTYYGKAQAARAKLRADVTTALMSVDIIATPTTPTPAFAFGAKKDPLSMYLEDIFTVPANITGSPALSVPMGGVVREGVSLPIGIQFMGRHNGEEQLFEVGKALTQEV